MKTAWSLDDPAVGDAPAVALTLGVYDGVHLGHARVLETVRTEAERLRGTPAVVTFHPHPRRVLGERGDVPLLTSLEHRIRLLAERGMGLCVVLPFDERLRREEPESFVRDRLLGAMDLRAVAVGPGFRFGRDGRGDIGLLRSLGAECGFGVTVVPPVEAGGSPVSSTAIRELVRARKLGEAARLLGRPYTISGVVIRGKGIGRALGVPTANIRPSGELAPPPGVYTARIRIEGDWLDGILNMDPSGTAEAHLFDAHEELYGRELEIEPGVFLREERVFDGREELAAQIRSDIAIARGILHNGFLDKEGERPEGPPR